MGDVAGNAGRVADALRRADAAGAALTVLPELALTGYPPEDLLLRPRFARSSQAALAELAGQTGAGAALVGFAEWDGDCFNSAALLAEGRVQAVYRKRFLPNYGVFDERRYFRPGTRALTVCVAGARVGVTICEDIWYATPIASELAAARLDLVCCLAASPYHRGKGDRREAMLATRAADCAAALAFCNQVGAQDALVFDGRSCLVDAAGGLVARAPQFAEDLLVADVDLSLAVRRRLREPLARPLPRPEGEPPAAVTVLASRAEPPQPPEPPAAPPLAPLLAEPAEVWRALLTGLGGYVAKNGFPGVAVGLSGGIDSALTAALAIEALGAQRVLGVAMPAPHSSPESLAGARALAQANGIRLLELPIGEVVDALQRVLAGPFAGRPPGLAEENLQARTRGTLLMALSNKLGLLVLATGNKSEASVGYATLYGDMVGGIAPIGDLSKSWVYRLARWCNATKGRPRIPEETIARPPTAELRPGQLDTDALPPYDLLDRILEGFVEHDLDVDEQVARGLPADVVLEVMRMVDRSEYKRRQGPFPIKVTPRAFGRDRRMPITSAHGAHG